MIKLSQHWMQTDDHVRDQATIIDKHDYWQYSELLLAGVEDAPPSDHEFLAEEFIVRREDELLRQLKASYTSILRLPTLVAEGRMPLVQLKDWIIIH